MQIQNNNTVSIKVREERSKLGISGGRAIKGEKGDKGDQGIQGPIGPMGPEGPQGIQGLPGRDGIDGKDGQDGQDGKGIKSLSLIDTKDKVKTYRIEFTDGTSFDYQVKDGEDGKDGKEGMSGGAVLRGAEKTSRKTSDYDTQSTETYPNSKALYDAIHSIKTIQFLVVSELPTTGESNIIYLVPSSEQGTGDKYEEWIYVYDSTQEEYSWEELGTEVDLTGYATEQWVTDQGYITGITSAMVTTALGYTPYNSTNPNGYQANLLEGVQVNGTDLTITNKKVNVSVPTQASDIGAQPTLVSGTNIKTVNGNSLLGSGNLVISGLPSQTSQSGKFLTTNGTSASWANIPTEIPSQSGQNGKFLTTNGSSVSWATVNALPSQTGNSGKYLTTNGTSASWGEIAEYTAQEVETLWGSL